MSDSILHEVAGGLARITLNRPEKRNALSLEMIDGLSRAIDAVREDPSTRVVLLTARGKAFCSGMDLNAVGNKVWTHVERAVHVIRNKARLTGARNRIARFLLPR